MSAKDPQVVRIVSLVGSGRLASNGAAGAEGAGANKGGDASAQDGAAAAQGASGEAAQGAAASAASGKGKRQIPGRFSLKRAGPSGSLLLKSF